jgi:hypothetical protein
MKANNLSKGKSLFGFSLMMLLGFGILLNGCYPGDALTPSQTDVISTFYKEGTDFSSKKTYAMPDSVLHIDKDGNVVDNSGQYDRKILNKIELNLTQIGYERESNPENANVLVTAFVTTTTWVSGGCYPSWSYWYPYSGWCYPVAYTYSTGTIVISMAEPDSQNEAQIIWFAGINGILEGGTAGISSRIDQNIDQAFNQSDYLGDGK